MHDRERGSPGLHEPGRAPVRREDGGAGAADRTWSRSLGSFPLSSRSRTRHDGHRRQAQGSARQGAPTLHAAPPSRTSSRPAPRPPQAPSLHFYTHVAKGLATTALTHSSLSATHNNTELARLGEAVRPVRLSSRQLEGAPPAPPPRAAPSRAWQDALHPADALLPSWLPARRSRAPSPPRRSTSRPARTRAQSTTRSRSRLRQRP